MTSTPKIERVIILGALSAIGEAVAGEFARAGAELVIVGRDEARLQQVSDNLQVLGASTCRLVVVDFTKAGDPNEEIQAMAKSLLGPVDAIMLFYGLLGDQELTEKDIGALRQSISTNFSSAAEWCMASANLLERQNHGVLLAVSSVAGDRGRQSNYVYGAAKAGLTTFMEGIAHRLATGRATAIVVKLGFVDTPMTAHLEKKGPLWAKPEQIARKLVALSRRPRRPVVYLPFFWRPIMLAVRSVPASLFHRTKL